MAFGRRPHNGFPVNALAGSGQTSQEAPPCAHASTVTPVARALRELDAGTSAHCGRTGGLADMLGRALQLSSQALETLRLAAELQRRRQGRDPRARSCSSRPSWSRMNSR